MDGRRLFGTFSGNLVQEFKYILTSVKLTLTVVIRFSDISKVYGLVMSGEIVFENWEQVFQFRDSSGAKSP